MTLSIVGIPLQSREVSCRTNATSNDLLRYGFRRIWHNFSKDFTVAPKDSEDDRFTRSSTAMVVMDPTWVEVGLVYPNNTLKRGLLLARLRDQYRCGTFEWIFR